MTASLTQGGKLGPPEMIMCSPSPSLSVSHLMVCVGVPRLLGEGEGVGQAGHTVVTGGDVGGVAGLGRGVTAARCVIGE